MGSLMMGDGWYRTSLRIMRLHKLLCSCTHSQDLLCGGGGSLCARPGILEGVTFPGVNFTTDMCSSVSLFLIGLCQLQRLGFHLDPLCDEVGHAHVCEYEEMKLL